MKLHHIGYLVKNIEKSMAAFRTLGYKAVSLCGEGDVMYDAYRHCDICFMELSTTPDSYIELISPKSKESPIYGLMSTYKNTPYHLCFESQDLEKDVAELEQAGWTMFQPATPAPAIDSKEVVFLINRNAGIIELVGL